MRGVTLLLLVGGAVALPQILVPGWPGHTVWPGELPGWPGQMPGWPGQLPGWPGQLPGGSADREPDSREHGGAAGHRQTSCKCGWTNKVSSRIVGGSVTEQNEHPFLVAIMDTMTGQQFCGGTIVTKRHVVTAAHCTENHVKERRPMHILAGAHSLTGGAGSQSIPVSRIGQHSLYNSQIISNDISVLELARDITFTSTVGPICIQRTPMELTDKYVKIVGWGNVRHEGPGSPVPKKVTTKVMPMSRCRSSYSSLTSNQFCTYSLQKGACMGDSGGPVVWLDPETNRYTLVGAVSFGKICASQDPTVHTSVISYMSWIQGQISGQATCEKI